MTCRMDVYIERLFVFFPQTTAVFKKMINCHRFVLFLLLACGMRLLAEEGTVTMYNIHKFHVGFFFVFFLML